MFVALAILILLSSLGVAIGIGTGATAAGIWGAISVIIGFFVGGWFAGRMLDVLDSAIATAHGVLVWAVAMIFTLVFTIVTAIAGINTLTNVARVTVLGNFVSVLGGGGAPGATNTALTSSWVAFIVLLLGLIAAVAGAMVGNRGRFVETTRS
jgi:nitrate reductase NapE component